MPHAHTSHHRLPLLKHRVEVAFNQSGQALQFAEIDGLWPNRRAGGIQPRPQIPRARVPAVGSI